LTQWFTHRQIMDQARDQSADIRDGIRHFVAVQPLLRSPQRRQVERMVSQPAA
jgi:hypothetical protein